MNNRVSITQLPTYPITQLPNSQIPYNSQALLLFQFTMRLVCVIAFGLILSLLACNQDTAKTREEAARTAQQVKQESKEATKELKKGAEEAGKQGKAIAEGVREGWNSDSKSIDLNSASKEQLMSLPGVNSRTADRIIASRPYKTKEDLTDRKIVTADEYQKIQDKITAR